MDSKLIYQFGHSAKADEWTIIDDVVMGGKSSGIFTVVDGMGVFEGNISVENNGGFSSIRHKFAELTTKNYTKFIITLKGDGKDYQFRIKYKSTDYHFYISQFSTSGAWEEVEFLLQDMYPSFRGRKLDQPNFCHDSIEELAFLIGNKKTEDFKLQIDKIVLR